MNSRHIIACSFFVIICPGCNDGHLRGSAKPSGDGATYFVVGDDNGDKCGSIYLDGRIWPHAIGQRGQIAAGSHGISCGAPVPDIRFEVPQGVEFTFDYWGP